MEYIQYEFSDTNKIHSIEKNSDSNRKKGSIISVVGKSTMEIMEPF